MSVAVDHSSLVAEDLSLPLVSVSSVIKLLNEGSSVPFIARYRKEATAGLDEVAIRNIEERNKYFTELEDRRGAILAEIEKQGKLTPELKAKLMATKVKTELEDLYLPFKPKRRTRAMIAREKGLEPLALLMIKQDASATPEAAASKFINEQVATAADALAGARDIVAETVAETAEVRAHLREHFMNEGHVVSAKLDSVTGPTKFEAYYEFKEPCATIPSHRFLAVRRGETDNVLRMKLEVDEAALKAWLLGHVNANPGSPWAKELDQAVSDAYNRLLSPSVESEVRAELKLRADRQAVDVFASNLRSLLLTAPLGSRAVIGIDPGQRTGCKVAVVDATGKMLDHDVIYLVQGEGAMAKSERTLLELIQKHTPAAIAIGNGTHGRETEGFVRDLFKKHGLTSLFSVSVNEAGASVYSASDVAREEFPDLDLTVRGAISIARRLQDPLSELVKVDPKSIGVGQYQHDVFQPLLSKKLDEVVESCVNQVGVELNTASVSLLRYVAGIGPLLAKRIVTHRDMLGPFPSRQALSKVAGLGPKTFEQCAGFLRINASEHPLDRSSVHPERYALVEQMAKDLGADVRALLGDKLLVDRIEWKKYVTAEVGELTLRDIIDELKKPGRDPRETFVAPEFRDDVRTMEDLKVGMSLEGVVTNVTAFGAFVDVGVHQDGLVHISELSDRFVKEASEVVKVGDKLRVRVLDVDLQRKRISLSGRSESAAKGSAAGASGAPSPRPTDSRSPGPRGPGGGQNRGRDQQRTSHQDPNKFSNNPFARLLNR